MKFIKIFSAILAVFILIGCDESGGGSSTLTESSSEKSSGGSSSSEPMSSLSTSSISFSSQAFSSESSVSSSSTIAVSSSSAVSISSDSQSSSSVQYDLTKLFSKSFEINLDINSHMNIGTIDEKTSDTTGMYILNNAGATLLDGNNVDKVVTTAITHTDELSVSNIKTYYLGNGFPVRWETSSKTCKIYDSLPLLSTNASIGYETPRIRFNCGNYLDDVYLTMILDEDSKGQTVLKFREEDSDETSIETFVIDTDMNILDYHKEILTNDLKNKYEHNSTQLDNTSYDYFNAINFSKPLGSIAMPEEEYFLDAIIHGEVLFLLNGISGSNHQRFYVLDISTPSEIKRIGDPILVTSGKLGSFSSMAIAKDSNLLFFNSKVFTTVYDVNQLANPMETITTYEIMSGETGSVQISDDASKMFVGTGLGLIIYDISDINNTEPLYVMTESIGKIILSSDGNRIYGASFGKGLFIVDVSEPTLPMILSTLYDSTNLYFTPSDFAMSKDESIMCSIDKGGFYMVDTSDYTNPTFLSAAVGERAMANSCEKGLMYLFGSDKIETIDTTDPKNIKYIDVFKLTSNISTWNVKWSEDRKNLFIFDNDLILVY